MAITVLLFLLLLLSSTLSQSTEVTDTTDTSGEAEREVVKITKQEFCEGCKETVHLYANKVAAKLQQMQDNKIPNHEVMDADSIIGKICDSIELDKYKDYIKYSCIAIFGDHREPFLSAFQGASTASAILQKGSIYERKKNVKLPL